MARSWIGRCWTILNRNWRPGEYSVFNWSSVRVSFFRLWCGRCTRGVDDSIAIHHFPMTSSEICYFILRINVACARNRKSMAWIFFAPPLSEREKSCQRRKWSAWMSRKRQIYEWKRISNFPPPHTPTAFTHTSIQLDNSIAQSRMRTYHISFWEIFWICTSICLSHHASHFNRRLIIIILFHFVSSFIFASRWFDSYSFAFTWHGSSHTSAMPYANSNEIMQDIISCDIFMRL